MSSRLRDLIKAVRACKTAAEERSIIAKESAALRNAFRDQDTLYRHRNVAKLMFIHMLGYPTHFGQMETLKLIAANGFPEKRIGYLGLMILLDERHEVLMLVTNSLKNDLNSRNQFSVGLALCALGNICSVEMARDLSPELEKLLASNNSYTRKKAAICCTRVLRKVPEAIESFQDRAVALLKDRHHAVMLGGVTLMLELCAIEPALVPVYQREVPVLCKMLRSLLSSGFMPEYDVGGITNPFLQVKILQLLRVLGRGNAEVSDQMSEVLAQVATNTESARNAGNSILYEAVQTIMGTESIGGLRVLAINILGRFLANKDNNIRYVALNTLARVVSVDTQAVQRHRQTIVDCVKDPDVSIRRRALDLVYALVNENNIKPLTKELLDYLVVCDNEFKPDLTAKICQLVLRFAPDKRWHFDSIMQVLSVAGAYAKEEVCRTLVVHISNAPKLHAYAARQAFRCLQEHQKDANLLLLTTTAWLLGEYGEQLVGGKAQPLEGEQPLSVSPPDLVSLLGGMLGQPGIPPVSIEYLLTALAKISTRIPGQSDRIKGLLEMHTKSSNLEIQSRACEYGQLFRFSAIKGQLLEAMPALDEATYMARFNAPAVVASGPSLTTGATGDVNGLTSDLGDLLQLDDDAQPATASNPATATPDYLHDLLDGPGPSGGAGATPTPAAAQVDLMDLLGGDDLSSHPAALATATLDPLAGLGAQAAPSTSQRQQMDPFEDLAGPPAAAAAPASWPTATVYQKNGILVTFDFSKPQANPSQTDIKATYTSTGGSSVTNFSLQAAVPKFMQLKLDPASGSSLSTSGPPVTQTLHVTNSQHGVKPLMLRLRLNFTKDGQATQDQAEVKNLPAGL